MADSAAVPHAAPHTGGAEVTKRDFLKLVAGAGAAVGVGAIAWPLIDSMNPSADVLALSSTTVDLAPITLGQAITVVWRGKPVFVRHRTPEEIQKARADDKDRLRDPVADAARVKAGHEQWLIVVGICTHLGCVPLGNRSTEARGDFGGWFCPCHGSHYDTAARVRKGPAPLNLLVPGYTFTSDRAVRIG
jgi:ubiquinol-cytochrome c reductase iron-sulfur subunit